MKITKKKGIIGLILGILFLTPLAIYGVNASKRNIPPEEKYYSLEGQEYVPDEMIVKFARGYEPEYLEQQMQEREVYKESALGKIVIVREDAEDTLNALPPIETRYEAVQNMFQQLQVTGYSRAVSGGDQEMEQFYVLEFPPGSDLAKKQEALSQHEAIEFIEANNIVELFQVTAPNDPFYPDMWGLEKIDAANGWQITTGSKEVTVAVVDTGVDRGHVDLSQNVLSGGLDTVNKDNNPRDDHGHGTHVSGTIGAITNNGTGVSGVNWNVNILPVKVCNSQGGCNEQTISDGLTYAADRGVDVVNMSLGSNTPCAQSPLIKSAVQYTISKGTTVVAAAGNGGKDKIGDDAATVAPASCNGVITVSSIDRNNRRPSYANFGSVVDIAAPGGSGTTLSTGIVSTIPGNQYSAISGTSMAAPHVAGVAALLLSRDPDLTPSKVKECIIGGGTAIATDRNIGPLLNLKGALDACQLQDEPTQVPPTQAQQPPPPSQAATQPPNPPTQGGSYSVGGIVFQDVNRNAQKDTGDPPIPGSTIILTGPGGALTAQTNANGEFMFPNLEPGNYSLTQSINNQQVWSHVWTLSDAEPHWYFLFPIYTSQSSSPDTPITTPPQGEEPLPTPVGGEQSDETTPSGSPTPTPTPLIFYDCQPSTTSRTLNGKQLRLTYLECTRRE